MRTLAVQSAINPATAASTTADRPLTAASPLALTAVAAGQKSATSAATSPMSLGSAASASVVRGCLGGQHALALAQTADLNEILGAAERAGRSLG